MSLRSLGTRKELEEFVSKLVKEKEVLFEKLDQEIAKLTESEDRTTKLQEVKDALDKKIDVRSLTGPSFSSALLLPQPSFRNYPPVSMRWKSATWNYNVP